MISTMEEKEWSIKRSKALTGPERWKNTGPPYQFTREELLEHMQHQGYKFSERQLRSWASYGILPHPERRVPAGAADRVARALYPVWTPHVLHELLKDVAAGATIPELKLSAPIYIEQYSGDQSESADGPPRLGLWPRIRPSLYRALTNYAFNYMVRHDVEVQRIYLTFQNDDGLDTTIEIPPPPQGWHDYQPSSD